MGLFLNKVNVVLGGVKRLVGGKFDSVGVYFGDLGVMCYYFVLSEGIGFVIVDIGDGI